MRRCLILFCLLNITANTQSVYSQKMTVKDADANILMEVNDEGSVGSITLPSGSAPTVTTNKLYNVGGVLYWNGTVLLPSQAGHSGKVLTTDGTDAGWTTLNRHSLDAADGSPTDVVYVDDAGEVGIGTTTPAYPLDVDGHMRTTSMITAKLVGMSGSVGMRAGDASHTGYVEWRQPAADGEVGIGVADPGARLEVAGQVKITGGTPGTGKVLTSDGVGLASWQTDNSLNAADGSPADALYVDNEGDVGIGTSAPNSKLEVAGTIHSTTGGVKFPDNTTQSTAATAQVGFGAWEEKAFDTDYPEAATDGIVVASVLGAHVLGGYTPTSVKRVSAQSSSASQIISITMPVKKGDTWRVNLFPTPANPDNPSLFWIPLGN